MKKRILNIVLSFSILIREIFPYALLIYLIFFLLENLLPGFVSNNFDLNNALVAVMILGFISVFAPFIEQKEEPPQKSDRNLIIILSILSFLVLFFRTRDMGVFGLVIAVVGSLLVAGMSAIIVYFPDREEDQFKEEMKVEKETVIAPVPLPKFHLFQYLKPIIYLNIALIVVIIGILVYKPAKKDIVNKYPGNLTPTVTVSPEVEEIVKPDSETLRKVIIDVLNGGSKTGSASAMAKVLTEKGFKIGNIADADRKDYQGALIRFRPEEYEVVEYIIDAIQNMYPDIVRAPLDSDKANVILILGRL